MKLQTLLDEVGLDEVEIKKIIEWKRRAHIFSRLSYALIGILVIMALIALASVKVVTKLDNNDVMKVSIVYVTICASLAIAALSFKNTGKKNRDIYGNKIKEKIVSKLLEKRFEDIFYNPSGNLKMSKLKSVGMFVGDVNYSNDVIKARYKNVEFTLGDLLMQNESSDSDGNTSITTIFSGRWMTFTFNKPFSNYLQIRSNASASTGLLGRIFKQTVTRGQTEVNRITFENKEFNEELACYTDDDHMSFYLLTPHMMERILKLKELYPDFYMFFADEELHIAIDGLDDSFEIGLDDISEAYIDEVDENINDIIVIIETLNIETDIFQ